jgi:uncharacterized protein YbjT (DUF2867 family)
VYDEHLAFAVGALCLGLGGASLAVIRSASARTVGFSWVVIDALHLEYRVTHLGESTLDRLGNLASLRAALVLAILLALPPRHPPAVSRCWRGDGQMRIAVAGGTGVVGAHVVAALQAGGYGAVVLARSTGVDLTSGVGLADLLHGIDAVIDVTSKITVLASVSRAFFGTMTRNLLEAERVAKVPHHVAPSIVGAANVDAGYFAGKRTQEDLLKASSDSWTVLRATQLHEFAAQIVERAKVGPVCVIPVMTCRPVAATEVAAALVRLATGAPQGLAPDLGGPAVENLASMSRRYLAESGRRRRVLEVPLPGAWGRSMRDGSVLPASGTQQGTITFEDWLRAL